MKNKPFVVTAFLASIEENLRQLDKLVNPLTQRPDVICLGHDRELAALPCNSTIH